jgi:F0F1-type ATP synthase delta subunit
MADQQARPNDIRVVMKSLTTQGCFAAVASPDGTFEIIVRSDKKLSPEQIHAIRQELDEKFKASAKVEDILQR